MKIRLDKNLFQKAISRVEGVISSRELKSQLSNILFEVTDGRLVLTATDLEIGIRTSMEVEVETAGEITLPARKLSQIVKAIPGDTVELTANEAHEAVILDNSGTSRARFAILGLPKSEFPNVGTIDQEKLVEFPNSLFMKMLRSTSFAIAEEDSRFVFNGLFVINDKNLVTFVATDGKRLAKIERDYPTEFPFQEGIIIPHKAVREIAKLLEPGKTSHIGLGNNQLLLKTDEVELFCNLIEGQYPNYNQVIPAEFAYNINLSRADLIRSIKSVSVLANEQSRQVRLSFEKEKLKIVAHTPEVGEADDYIYCDYSGETVEIGFNYEFILDAASVIESEDMILGLNNSVAPLVLKDKEDDSFVAVVMPMKL